VAKVNKIVVSKLNKSRKNSSNVSKRIIELVKKSIFNVVCYRINEWVNFYFQKKGLNKEFKNKKFLRRYYEKEIWDIDIKKFAQFVTRVLSIERRLALSEKFDEEQQFEFQLEYVESAIEYLKEMAFRDELVINTLNKLRLCIHGVWSKGRIPLSQRRAYKERFEKILDRLNINAKLSGKDRIELPIRRELIVIDRELRKIVSKIYSKKYTNSELTKAELKKAFPPSSDEELEELFHLVSRKKYAEASQHIIAWAYSIRPRTVQDKLYKARKLSK